MTMAATTSNVVARKERKLNLESVTCAETAGVSAGDKDRM